ncbi:winged helix-turn-helix domain-containing protein [Phenylobacterium sp.]|uniref:winged helix-turn-helix domain-containing protein n=1 Tax=Phenylobacterium sp. TaxID=1871053 RepID=UPI00273312AA|nr:winged helix-turn-helix domain-containing protein [Phenylobacterium sp.]MDP3855782.1 winged helix-turn-helix domain-containing protein [Phenylobacterium sp.]
MADDGSQLAGETKSFAPHRRLDLANEHDFQLGAFRVRPAYREVRRGDVIDILEPRVMQVLAALARRMGAVVSRDELLRDCWGDVSVTDDSLHRCIGRLRKLSESDDRASFVIETVPRVGYRLVAADLVAGLETQAAAVDATPEAQAARRLGHLPLLVLGGLVAALLGAGGWWMIGRDEAWRVAGFESAADTLASEGQPALSASGGQLAYAAGPEDGSQDIFVRNVRDGSTALLVGGPTDDGFPAWSPTGDRLAFVRLHPNAPCEIVIKTLPDGPERSLAACRKSDTSKVVWAPDGARLYFIDRPARGAARQVYSVAAEGGPVTPVTSPPAWMRGDQDLTVSPDGAHMAFVRWSAIGISDIYVQSLSGGQARRVTQDGAEVVGLAWSTTGRSLFFSSNRSGDFGVWSVAADGGEPVRLGSGLREVRRISSGGDGALALELMDLRANLAQVGGGAASKLITDEAGIQWAGDISPAGVLAYVADTRAGRSVWTRAPGQPAQKLTFFPATHMDDVRWSPDGRRLAFIAAAKGRYGVYEIPAGGGPPKALLTGDYEMTSLSWEADGRTLVLAAKRGGVRRLWRLDTTKPDAVTPITGPGWVAVRATPKGLLGMKQFTPGIWRLNGDGSKAQQIADSPSNPTNAWMILGERQFWIDWPAGRAPVILSSAVDGGPVSVVAEAPGATFYSGLAMDPATGAMIYTRKIRMDVDIGLMRLERAG